MKKRFLGWIVLMLILLAFAPAQAQQHTATRLGNPNTRFAKPLQFPEDFRILFRSEALRADVDSIIRQCHYQGDLADLRRAAAEAPIYELKIPVGTRLPAMSTRKNGQPVLLLDVLWAGKEPIDAYEFFFTSKGRRYRVVSPKACSNFWVEDKGREPRPVLVLNCEAPEEVPLRRPAQVCLNVRNTGDGVEPLATVTLPIPAGATFVSATAGGTVTDGRVVWELPNFAAGGSNQVCALIALPEPGAMAFASTLRGQIAPVTESRCDTRVFGIPAVLIEVVDLIDPIDLDAEETYEISVLNQGSAVLTNLKFVCTLEESQKFISGSGVTPVSAAERIITLETLPALNPNEKAVWRVVVKTLTAGDVRFNAELTCDQFQKPIRENESTRQY